MRSLKNPLYNQISERVFTAQIIQLAKAFGWLVNHQRPAMTKQGWRTAISGDAGFPDCVMLRQNRAIFAELKSDKGKLTYEQLEWLELARSAGIEAYCWKPRDIDEIEKILK